jgi:hypothetical protein
MKKKLFKKSTIFFFSLVFITTNVFYFVFFPTTMAHAQEEMCTRWSLVWIIPPEGKKAGESVGIGQYGILANPISASPGILPALPEELDGKAKWICVEINPALGSAKTESEKKLPGGTEACQKAVKIATKFSGFTVIDGLQDLVLGNITSFLNEEIFSGTGINVSDIKGSVIDVGEKIIGPVFDTLIGNPIKSFFSGITDSIEQEVKERLASLSNKFVEGVEDAALKAATNAIGKTAEGIPIIGGAIGGAIGSFSPDLVEDREAIRQLKIIEKKIDQSIAEQKKSEAIADTRQKCELLLKNTIETIKRSLLYQLSTQITDWIARGEEPQFIKDPGGFLKDVAQLAIDRTISRIAPRLCESFQFSITAQIPTTNREANPFYEELTCTLDQVTNNIEAFYNDFRNGGWISYQEMWKPQNNYYGASMVVQEELAQQQMAATQLAEADIQRGSGFPSQTQCTEWQLYVPTDCKFNDVQKRMADVLQVGGDCYIETDEIYGSTDDGKAPPLSAATSAPPTGSYWQCRRSEITNPGTVTARLAEKAQQIDLDQISNSDDIENFLGTIEDSIINKLVKSGVTGLQKLLKGLPPLNL